MADVDVGLWESPPGSGRTGSRPGQALAGVLEQLAAADARAVRDTVARLDLAAVADAAHAIAVAGRVDIYGGTGSVLVRGELRRGLHRAGVAAWCWTDLHEALASAATLGPADVALGVSHSGRNRETIEVLAEAGSHGATTVALTSYPRSALTDVADVVLVTAVPGTPLRPDVLSARHPQLVVLDLLCVAVAQRLQPGAGRPVGADPGR